MSIPLPNVPGTVLKFIGSSAPRVAPSAADTVALPVVHDWGPVGTDAAGANGLSGGAQLLAQFSDWTGLYGDSDTAGRTAVAGAFAGQGLPDAGGAGGVLAWRIGGTGCAPATITIDAQGGGTPAALTLQGYYKGTRGNRISYSIDNDPSDSTRDRIQIFFDGVLQDSYIYNPAGGDTVATLTAQIAKRSRLVTPIAVLPASVARLVHTTVGAPVSLAGGNDGATPVSADHLAALAGLQFQSFGILAVYDLTNSSIQASYYSWLQDEIAAMRPRRWVLGGAAAEVLADAETRSATFDDPHVINFGIGTWHDDLLDKDLSTSQLAPRIAGILAAKGQQHSMTFAEIAGIHMLAGASEDELPDAIAGGVVTLGQTSSPDADVHIVMGVTTYTDQNDPTQPYDVFSDARLVGVMDNFIIGMKQWGDSKVIGNLPVNDTTRAMVRGQVRLMENDLLRQGLLLPGDSTANPPIPDPWVVCEPPNDPSLAAALPFTFGWQFADTANNILGEGQVL